MPDPNHSALMAYRTGIKLLMIALGFATLAVDATWASAAPSLSVSHLSAATTREPALLGSSSPSSSETFRIRPDVLPLSGDGTAFVGGPGWKAHGRRILSFGRIEWTSFGGAQASGQGLMWLNDCTPDCADGSFQHYPAKIQASSVQKHHYTKLSVTFKPGSRTTTGRYILLTAGSNSYWQRAPE